MNEQTATRRIPAPLHRLYAVLTTPAAIPEWNPAIHTLAGTGPAETGRRYRITTRGFLRGYLDYPAIRPERIETHIKVQGMEEFGYWQLTDDGASTVVEHGFHHRGPLARLLAGAYQGVGELRLDRLAARVTAPA